MSRANLKLAPVVKRQRPTFAQLRRALELYRSDYADKATRHANARKWIAANAMLGDKHILKGGDIRWGMRRG